MEGAGAPPRLIPAHGALALSCRGGRRGGAHHRYQRSPVLCLLAWLGERPATSRESFASKHGRSPSCQFVGPNTRKLEVGVRSRSPFLLGSSRMRSCGGRSCHRPPWVPKTFYDRLPSGHVSDISAADVSPGTVLSRSDKLEHAGAERLAAPAELARIQCKL